MIMPVRDMVVLSESLVALDRDMADFREEFIGQVVPTQPEQYHPREETMRKWITWWRWRGYYNFRLVWHPTDRRITLEPSRD